MAGATTIKVFPLRYADAKELATLVKELFPAQTGAGGNNNRGGGGGFPGFGGGFPGFVSRVALRPAAQVYEPLLLKFPDGLFRHLEFLGDAFVSGFNSPDRIRKYVCETPEQVCSLRSAFSVRPLCATK
jgi:hypothetical protein